MKKNEERKVRMYVYTSDQRVVIVDDCMKEMVVEKKQKEEA